MTLKTEEAIKVAEKIRDNLERNPFSISNLRQYYNLVELIEQKNEVNWINNELYGYKNSDDVPGYRKVSHHNDNTISASIRENYTTVYTYGDSDKTYSYTITKSNERFKIHVSPINFLYILNFVDNEIYRKTIIILNKLKVEKIEFDIFEETRKTVNEKLYTICPKALNKLTETYKDLMESETPLDLQKISFSCRTVLNDFAEAVYPPTKQKVKGFDDKTHPLTDNNPMNRIIQFTYENIESGHNQDFMKSNLEYLSNFLNSIYKLSNVGTHSEREKEHAKRCVVYTYLVIGDIINLTNLNLK
jgi:hypothetical protein